MQSFTITSAFALMAGFAIALPNPATEYTYDIKDFTEVKTYSDDITAVTFDIVGTDGSTVDIHCVPWDVQTKKQVTNWRNKVLYPCGENLPFYFSFNRKTNDLYLITGGALENQFDGTVNIADPVCQRGPQDQVCKTAVDAEITVRKAQQ